MRVSPAQRDKMRIAPVDIAGEGKGPGKVNCEFQGGTGFKGNFNGKGLVVRVNDAGNLNPAGGGGDAR